MIDRNEDDLLKSAALQNAQSILAARLHAERELIQSKEALARRADELAEEREWFRIVLSSIGDAVITTDVKGKVTFLNPEAELLTGWSASEALGQPLESVFNIVNEKTREATPNRIADVLREGISAAPPRYAVLIARNGMEAAIEDSATPVRTAAGIMLGAVLVFRDLAERIEAK